ncbi:hypothetical protein J5751_02550, partial [bacterium]|nr:hypothetical protein [bacterium]
TLVYQTGNGKFESDKKIREDLSNLIGFEINYRKDGCNHETTAIILFSTINEKDLLSLGKPTRITLGKVRKFAESIHPFAKIINENIVMSMWQHVSDFYTMKFMLGKKKFEFPGIMSMNSCEESVSDNQNTMDHRWGFVLNKTEIFVEACSPIWCYITKE